MTSLLFRCIVIIIPLWTVECRMFSLTYETCKLMLKEAGMQERVGKSENSYCFMHLFTLLMILAPGNLDWCCFFYAIWIFLFSFHINKHVAWLKNFTLLMFKFWRVFFFSVRLFYLNCWWIELLFNCFLLSFCLIWFWHNVFHKCTL